MPRSRVPAPSQMLLLLLLTVTCAVATTCGGGGGGGNPPPQQNQAPTAAFSAAPIAGKAPLAVDFDAGLSSDPDGVIRRFQWDFNGDSFIDLDSPTAQARHLFTEDGTFNVTLQVVDNGSAADTASLTVSVDLASYSTTPVDGPMSFSASLSATLVAGRPAVCRVDRDSGELRYSSAQDSTGSLWRTPVVIDSAADFVSLAEVGGRPAVVYHRPADSLLLYLRANDAEGQSWPAPASAVIVSPEANLITNGIRLFVSGGNPMVVIGVATGPFEVSLFTVRADDPAGAAWSFFSVPITQFSDSAGVYASAVVNGIPAVAVGDRGGVDIRYLQATDSSGTSWPTAMTEVFDGVDSFSTQFFLREVEGRPNIVGTMTLPGDLEAGTVVLQASDTAGTDWARNTRVPDFPEAFVMDFEVIAGFPAIVLDSTNSEVITVLMGTNELGDSFEAQLTAAAEDGFPAELVEVAQRPAVAFARESDQSLAFAASN